MNLRLHHSLNQPYLSRMFLLCLPRMCLYVAACTVLYCFTYIHQALACTHTHPGCNRDTCSSKIPISDATTMSTAKLYLGNTESSREWTGCRQEEDEAFLWRLPLVKLTFPKTHATGVHRNGQGTVYQVPILVWQTATIWRILGT